MASFPQANALETWPGEKASSSTEACTFRNLHAAGRR